MPSTVGYILSILVVWGFSPTKGASLPPKACKANDGKCNQAGEANEQTGGLAMLQQKTINAKVDAFADSSLDSTDDGEEFVQAPHDEQTTEVKPSDWYRITKARLDAKYSNTEPMAELEETENLEGESSYEVPNAQTGVNDVFGKPAPNCSFMGPVPDPQTSCDNKGKLYEGACWYLDSSKSSLHDCNAVCEKKGLMYDPMTRYVGGDCGNAFKCSQLGHLFNMPGDSNKGQAMHSRYRESSCLGCLIYDRGFMMRHIVDNDGDWMKQYKGQGVGWMPGQNSGKEIATDARCSANKGPPTRICACKPKGEIGSKCGEHGSCTSGFCKGAPASSGESSGLHFAPEEGQCSLPAAVGAACDTHEGCKTGYCYHSTGKCAAVSWTQTNGAALPSAGRLTSPWCLSNGPSGCALVLSMNEPSRSDSIAKAKRICAMIDECKSVWCCTTGCTNAICYGTTATSPNYKGKDCPGLKGSFRESKIPVQMWTIKRPGSPATKPADTTVAQFFRTVPRTYTKVELDWTGVENQKNSKCFQACGNRGGTCDWCGPKGACCQAGFIEWELGKPSLGCDEDITRSAGHDGFGCVPASKDRPKKMHDANTGEALTFLPMEQRFRLPSPPSFLKKDIMKENKKLPAVNYQVLLKGYQCGPPTSTWAKTYHEHSMDGWQSVRWCLTEAKKKGAKAILWTNGWTGSEQGMRFVEPSYNCAFETTKDVECPEGFTKVRHRGAWYYIEVLPDGPLPKVDGSFTLKGSVTDKDVVHAALVASALGGVKPEEIELIDLEKHAGGGTLVQYVTSVRILMDISKQLKDPKSKLAKSSIGSFLPDVPSSGKGPGSKNKGKGKGKGKGKNGKKGKKGKGRGKKRR